MFDDLDETIRELLIAELPITAGEIGVEFDQPKREWSARLSRPTINFFLYDVRENVQLRQYQPRYSAVGRNTAERKRPPTRLDCHYIITAWATEAADEHRLLARTMHTLLRFNQIPRERLMGRMAEQPFEITSKLASHDKLPNPAEVWSALDNEVRPSVSFIITLAMDPYEPEPEPIVQSLGLDMYRTKITAVDGNGADGTEDADDIKRAVRDEFDTRHNTIAGIVRDSEGVPQADVQVALRNTGFITTANAYGEYRLRGLHSGDYTLVVWPRDPDAKPVEKSITVPNNSGNYDLDL